MLLSQSVPKLDVVIFAYYDAGIKDLYEVPYAVTNM